MARLNLVAVHLLAGIIQVICMNVDLGSTRNQVEGFREVGAQFFQSAGTAGIIAGGLNAAGQRIAVPFKAEHIVALPAMQRDGSLVAKLDGLVGVYPDCRIGFAGQFIGFFNI